MHGNASEARYILRRLSSSTAGTLVKQGIYKGGSSITAETLVKQVRKNEESSGIKYIWSSNVDDNEVRYALNENCF